MLKDENPVGKIMNSYMANKFPACFPPLITLRLGTGVMNLSPLVLPEKSPMYLKSEVFFSAAPALAKAKETAKIELAPNFPFYHPY